MTRRGPLPLIVMLIAAVLTLAVAGCDSTPAGGGAATPPPPAATPSDGSLPGGPAAHPAAVAAAAPGVVPTRIVVSAIGAASSLDALGLNPDRTLQVPPVTDPGQAAWYRGSPVPGNKGPAVIVGHINGGGRPGVFVDLAEVQRGAMIDVDRSDGTTVEFRVTRKDLVPKNAFPTSEVYSDTGNSQVRLISCGGDLDSSAHSYEDNVVVYAELVGAHRT